MRYCFSLLLSAQGFQTADKFSVGHPVFEGDNGVTTLPLTPVFGLFADVDLIVKHECPMRSHKYSFGRDGFYFAP